MRIAIFAMGTRGDVQPYIALGKGLHAASHDVRLVTHPNFQSLVTEHGLEFWPVRGDVQEIAESKEMRELIERGNFIAITRQTAKEAQKAALVWAEDGQKACHRRSVRRPGAGREIEHPFNSGLSRPIFAHCRFPQCAPAAVSI
jgi:sterol 3beta-glucosyltransferase